MSFLCELMDVPLLFPFVGHFFVYPRSHFLFLYHSLSLSLTFFHVFPPLCIQRYLFLPPHTLTHPRTQVALHAHTSFVCGACILLGEVLRAQPQLRALITEANTFQARKWSCWNVSVIMLVPPPHTRTFSSRVSEIFLSCIKKMCRNTYFWCLMFSHLTLLSDGHRGRRSRRLRVCHCRRRRQEQEQAADRQGHGGRQRGRRRGRDLCETEAVGRDLGLRFGQARPVARRRGALVPLGTQSGIDVC